MKKTNSLFRTVLLALLMSVACSIYAQNQFWVGGIHYQVTSSSSYSYHGDGTAKVVAANGDGYSGVINIPSFIEVEVDGQYGDHFRRTYRVNEIGNGAFRRGSRVAVISLLGNLACHHNGKQHAQNAHENYNTFEQNG